MDKFLLLRSWKKAPYQGPGEYIDRACVFRVDLMFWFGASRGFKIFESLLQYRRGLVRTNPSLYFLAQHTLPYISSR